MRRWWAVEPSTMNQLSSHLKLKETNSGFEIDH